MAVTFTGNIGLAKPTESEFAKEWARNSQLQDDNNVIITAKTNIGLTAYTPVLKAQTSDPTLGAGYIRGEYQEIQGMVWGSFVIGFSDPGPPTVGSGEYGISLPFTVDGAFHTVGNAFNNAAGNLTCIGEGYIWDESSIANSGTCALDAVTVGGVSYARLVTETFTGKTSRVFRDSMPFAVSNQDKFGGSFFYRHT